MLDRPCSYGSRSLYNSGYDESLLTTQGSRLNHRDPVTDLGCVRFVMRHELRRPSLDLSVERVPHPALDRNDDTLVELVPNDNANHLSFAGH